MVLWFFVCWAWLFLLLLWGKVPTMIVIPETGLFDLVETFWSYKYVVVVVVLMSKCQKNICFYWGLYLELARSKIIMSMEQKSLWLWKASYKRQKPTVWAHMCVTAYVRLWHMLMWKSIISVYFLTWLTLRPLQSKLEDSSCMNDVNSKSAESHLLCTLGLLVNPFSVSPMESTW